MMAQPHMPFGLPCQPFGHRISKVRDCIRSSPPVYQRLWSNKGSHRLPIAPESKGLGKCSCTSSCEVGSCLNALMLMECGPSNCSFPSCSNRPFTTAAAGHLDDLTEVFWTGSAKGFGLRAATKLLKNQLVAEYLGEIVSQSSIQNWRYIMSLPQGFAIDASVAGGPARFINHSCEPNCNAQRWLVEGRWHVGIFANRNILPEEELTFSYSNGRSSRGNGFESSDPCHCGASRCSGRIAEPPKKHYGTHRFAEAAFKKRKLVKAESSNRGLFKRHKSGDFKESIKSSKSEKSSLFPESDEKLEKPMIQNPSCAETHTDVVEVDDIIELSDLSEGLHASPEFAEKMVDEEETLQDLLSAAQPKMESGKGMAGMAWQEAPGEAKKWMEKHPPKDHEITAMSLGLYLPSALRRARELTTPCTH